MAAVQIKLTLARGKTSKDVVLAAGDAISGGNKIALNVDVETITRREALDMIEGIRRWIIEHPWPPAAVS
jgi:hypothetical protein